MKEFPKFSTGDPITAAKMNQLVDYAGVASSSVPGFTGSFFGSRDANGSSEFIQPGVILVFATEDFIERETDHNSVDDCPSGLCNFVDLIRSSNQYTNQTQGRPFYVHDPVAGVTGSASKMQNDAFHAVFNKNSKRWEVLSGESGVSSSIRHAITCRCLGNSYPGWYVMELVDELTDLPPDCDPLCESTSVSASVSDEECDLCTLNCLSVSDDLTTACGAAGGFDSCRQAPAGTGVFVYAYDKRALPLKVGGAATIAWLGDRCSSSNSVSQSVSDEVPQSERLYTVLNGEYKLVQIPHEIWECCTVGATREVRKVACFTFIVEGFMCTGPVDPCGSESV